jgi:hypothetical protein
MCPILSLKKNKVICLALEHPWRNPFVFLLLKNFFYLGGYLSMHLHKQILYFGGGAMKTNFQMLAFYQSKSLEFWGLKLKLNVFLTLLVC